QLTFRRSCTQLRCKPTRQAHFQISSGQTWYVPTCITAQQTYLGLYESSEPCFQWLRSAFRRTISSGSSSIRASTSLSKARGIVCENNTRGSAFVPDIRTRRGLARSRQMVSASMFPLRGAVVGSIFHPHWTAASVANYGNRSVFLDVCARSSAISCAERALNLPFPVHGGTTRATGEAVPQSFS